MKWTTKVPSVEGWYFYKHRGINGKYYIRVIYIAKDRRTGKMLNYSEIENGFGKTVFYERERCFRELSPYGLSGYFSGPIAMVEDEE